MSESKTICIIHVSDLHAREEKRKELEIRSKAFFTDCEKLGVEPDLLVLTGDIAFSGKTTEYGVARDSFLQPAMKRLRLRPERIVLCPGNHDVDRDRVDLIAEKGLEATIVDTEAADGYLNHPEHILPRSEAYRSFLSQFYGSPRKKSYFSYCHDVRGVRLGVASFDSAWRCSNDNSKDRIFLTLGQINELCEPIEDAVFKVAVLHHPLDWFHPSESALVLHDLQRQFQLILTGHLHSPESLSAVTPSSQYVLCTVPSFFDGNITGIHDGYNIYSIDFPGKSITIKHRKFIRQRAAFDKNVDHAEDGTTRLPLPTMSLQDLTRGILAQSITAAGDNLYETVRANLRTLQRVDEPILVSPLVKRLEWKKGQKVYSRVSDPLNEAIQNNCIIYGAPDVGTTVFVQTVAAELNRNGKQRYAVYVDCKASQHSIATTHDLVIQVHEKVREAGIDPKEVALTAIIDHLPTKDKEALAVVLNAALSEKWHVIITIKNEVLFEALAAKERDTDLAFLGVFYWGPSRLREFTKGYLVAHNLDVDHDAAFHFVHNSFAISDLPVTPIIAALYLRAFIELGNQMNSLSFIRLLERLEERNLDSHSTASTYSLYNLRTMLRKLALLCFQTGQYEVEVSDYKKLIHDFFSQKYLTVDVDRFLFHLTESGLASLSPSGAVSFSCCAFLDYYLAQALENGDLPLHGQLGDLDQALSLGDAMAFYAGRQRDDVTVAHELMHCIEDAYSCESEITVEDLERHVKHLISPQAEEEDRDKIATRALQTTIDYEKTDDDFREMQAAHGKNNRSLKRYSPPTDDIEQVSREILSLKVFYNVFRNMEHLDGEEKVRLLDKILDYHMQCNMSLITLFRGSMDDEDFGSLVSYLVTIGGQSFMTQNIGTSTLRIPIELLLERTGNEFKRLLLLSLYADLGLPDYTSRLQDFIMATDKPSLIEMGYLKIHELMIRYEGDKIPSRLISAFNAAFEKRQKLYGKLHPINLQRMRDSVLKETKRQHALLQSMKTTE